ncbi:MAG: TIGR02186 family protein, partial [Pseudolabrys sp.]
MTSLARLCAFVAFLALSLSARSEELVVTVAPSQIAVSSSYSGGTVVVFGAIVQPNTVQPRNYDVAVIVMGPRQTVVARRKGRMVGVWINQESRTFYNVPSFLGVRASRPLNEIASADILRRQGIGLKNVLFDAGVSP